MRKILEHEGKILEHKEKILENEGDVLEHEEKINLVGE
tara:strand:- start:241 stop:354 length:114 start_codon:yes stop_codon:yes gene_type:complete